MGEFLDIGGAALEVPGRSGIQVFYRTGIIIQIGIHLIDSKHFGVYKYSSLCYCW